MHLLNEHEFVERSWKQFNILLLVKSLQWTLFWVQLIKASEEREEGASL